MYKLYIHAGSDNHGCEAIVRTTVKMLEEPITLFSRNPELDKKYGLERICNLVFDEKKDIDKGSVIWLSAKLQIKLLKRIDILIRNQYSKLFSDVKREDIYFSIGGDNYCYPGTEVLATINRNIRKKGAKTVLWGCSVEESIVNNVEAVKDLATFDLITARETISYNTLIKINKNTILVSDPAFTLKSELKQLPEGWIEGNMVGINASPLILNSGTDGNAVLDAYKVLIRNILENTEFGVALIPHVVCEGNDDRIVLNELYETFKESKKIVMIEDSNCMELKGYISRCRFFVGARTHATIAAYSSCVPTLVLGYSVKSRGIAKDLFGTDDNYVLQVQSLNNTQKLSEYFAKLVRDEQKIRNTLENIMPEYILKAYLGLNEIKKMV